MVPGRPDTVLDRESVGLAGTSDSITCPTTRLNRHRNRIVPQQRILNHL